MAATKRQLIAALKKHSLAIGKERDGLRDLMGEIEGILDSSDRAVEALEEAVYALSEQL